MFWHYARAGARAARAALGMHRFRFHRGGQQVAAADREGRGWIGWAQVGLIVVLALIGIYFAQAPQVPTLDAAATRSAEAPRVGVLRPVPSAHALTVALTGEVGARKRVRLRSSVAGRVVAVSPSLRAGGTFSAGETLLTLDSEDSEYRLQRARGLLDAARGRLRKQREKGAFEAQEYRRRNPGKPVPGIVERLPQIERFEGRVQAAQADVKLAEWRLANTRLSMPFDGTVIAAPVAVGEIIGPTHEIGIVYPTGDVEVRAPISADELAYLGDPRGRAAVVRVGARRFDAVVSGVSAVLAPKTRLSMLFLDFAAAPGQTPPPPGAFARVTLRGPAFENAFLLPDAAHRTGDAVWIVDGGTLERATPRTLGRTQAGWIVAAFDIRDGVVVGAVPGEQAGLSVTAVAAGAQR